MRILIVEDDAAVSFYLKIGLQLEGYEVTLAADGQAGISCAIQCPPDVMLLDLQLPTKDGFQVLEELRGRIEQTSILVLTAREDVEDRIKCLNLGADDCLVKPFSLRELTARCKALSRRRAHCANAILRIGDLDLDRVERTVTRSGNLVQLTSREFSLLEYLVKVPGRVCSRRELLLNVWQGTPGVGTNVVDVYVNYVRKKLSAVLVQGFDGVCEADRIIETVKGEGYVIYGSSKPYHATVAHVPILETLINAIPIWAS